MRKKILTVAIIVAFMLLTTPLAHAQPDRLTVWADKPKYAPGEKGTMYITYFNNRDGAVEIKNITVHYLSWEAYVGGSWVGNQTYDMSVPLTSKAVNVFNQVVFNVPSDGRAKSTTVDIVVGTDKGPEHASGYINVEDTPRSAEQIVMLFTIQIVLLIICTIIVAATIFLSARRPQITWKPEEKTE